MNAVTRPVPTPLPWWRFGIVWLVFGGPAVVVVAACVTGFIAMRNADPVLPEYEHPTQAPSAHATAPAELARNHVASPRH